MEVEEFKILFEALSEEDRRETVIYIDDKPYSLNVMNQEVIHNTKLAKPMLKALERRITDRHIKLKQCGNCFKMAHMDEDHNTCKRCILDRYKGKDMEANI